MRSGRHGETADAAALCGIEVDTAVTEEDLAGRVTEAFGL